MPGDAKDIVGKAFLGSTPYDILGYMAPGGALVLCCFLFELWINRLGSAVESSSFPVYSLFREVAAGLEDRSWAIEAMFVVVAIGAIYVIGHIVASVAAILLERQLVQHGHGYPMQRLLGIEQPPTTPVSRFFWRAAFFWLNIYLLLRYAEVAMSIAPQYTPPPSLQVAATTIGWLLIAMMLVKLALSSRPALSNVHGDKYKNPALRWCAAGLKILSMPYDFVANPLSRSLSLRSSIAPPIRDAFVKGMKERHGLESTRWGTEAYWQSYMCIRRAGTWVSEPADNWLRLYSFSRNLAAALFIAYLYCYAVLSWNAIELEGKGAAIAVVTAPLGLLVAALVMFCRYYYLYAAYYTKYLIRAFVSVISASDQSAGSQV